MYDFLILIGFTIFNVLFAITIILAMAWLKERKK